jgi:hypothetical protein
VRGEAALVRVTFAVVVAAEKSLRVVVPVKALAPQLAEQSSVAAAV